MQLQLDPKYLSEYYHKEGFKDYRIAQVRFLSSTQGNLVTNGFIQDVWNGYINTPNFELYRLGNSVQVVTGLEDLINLPYSSRLRQLDGIDVLKKGKKIMVVGVEFIAFDVTNTGVNTSIQNQTVNNAIITSLSNLTGADVITRGKNTIPITWLDNLFRPIVNINGINICDFTQKSAYGNGENKGDLSMGNLIPFSLPVYLPIGDTIQNIQINATCGQFVEVGADLWCKKYPLMATLTFAYAQNK